MTAQGGNSIPKTFQEEVVDAILAGDLQAFKKCCVGKNDIDRRLLPTKDLKPRPKINTNERYIPIKGPTMVMFCILCEQSEILEYILLEKNPDLSKRVDGYNCVHLAAMVKDPKCLQLLLREEWVQQNINLPIEIPGTPTSDTHFATVLHAAVTNKRLANTFLLLTDFPPVRETAPQKQTEEEGESQPSSTVYSSASLIDQKSISGSTPLYIAVFLENYPLVRILLCLGADPTIGCISPLEAKSNQSERTPLQLALELKDKNQKRKEKLKDVLTGKVNQSTLDKESDIDRIVKLLQDFNESGSPDTPEFLMHEYCPELEEPTNEEEDTDENQDEGSKNETIEATQTTQQPHEEASEPTTQKTTQPTPEKKKKPRATSNIDNSILTQILEKVSQIDRRLQVLENQQVQQVTTTRPTANMTNLQRVTECCVCHSSDATSCPTCHNFYCDTCMRKQHIHHCTLP